MTDRRALAGALQYRDTSRFARNLIHSTRMCVCNSILNKRTFPAASLFCRLLTSHLQLRGTRNAPASLRVAKYPQFPTTKALPPPMPLVALCAFPRTFPRGVSIATEHEWSRRREILRAVPLRDHQKPSHDLERRR